MNRRHYLKLLGGLSACFLPTPAMQMAAAKKGGSMKLIKSKYEWAALLPPATYRVMFEEDTEPAGSSPLGSEKRDGTFICTACAQPLFDSKMKLGFEAQWNGGSS